MSLLLTSIITRPHIPGPLTQVTLENTTFCPKRKQNRLPFHCQPFFRDVPSLFVWGMVTIDKGSSRWSPAPCLVRIAEKIQDMTDVPKQRKDGSPLGLHMNCTIFSNVLLCLSFLCCIFWIPCNTTSSLDQQIDSRKCFFAEKYSLEMKKRTYKSCSSRMVILNCSVPWSSQKGNQRHCGSQDLKKILFSHPKKELPRCDTWCRRNKTY